MKLFDRDVIAVETVVKGEKQDAFKVDLDKLFAHRARFYKPPGE